MILLHVQQNKTVQEFSVFSGLIGFILVLTIASPALAQNSPSLSETTTWLSQVLERREYAADFSIIGEVGDFRADYSFDGCILTIHRASWRHLIDKSRKMSAIAEKVTFAWVRFEPRAGLNFNDRKMTDIEARDFRSAHGDHEPGSFFGNVDTIDFSKIRLSSFSIVEKEPKTPFFSLPAAVIDNDGKFAFFDAVDESLVHRIATATQHAARLCGAVDDPF